MDLFGRDALSPNEKMIIKMANKTAIDLFKKRFSPYLRDNWDVNVKDVTIEEVEKSVVLALSAQGVIENAKNSLSERAVW